MQKNNKSSAISDDEAAIKIAKGLKNIHKPCSEEVPRYKRRLASGFALAYACGVLSTTISGCTTISKQADNNLENSKKLSEKELNNTERDSSNIQIPTNDLSENYNTELIIPAEQTNSVTQTEPEQENNISINTKEDTMNQENNNLLATELPEFYFNKAERAAESVKVQLGEEAYQNTIDTLGNPSTATSQGSYVADLIDSINSSSGMDATTRVMRACGYQCIEPGILDNAKKLYQESADMEEFLQKLSISLGGSNLNLKDNKIIAIYDTCYCNIHDTDNKLNGCYCQCSCGWYEKLFATVLDAPVNVELVKSIKGGADHCEFEITY